MLEHTPTAAHECANGHALPSLSNSFAIANFVLLYAWTDGTQLQYQWFNYFLPAIEFVLLFAVLACLISLVYYGLYWTAAFVVQVVSLRLVLWKFPFAKRVSTASAIFWLSHGAFEASMLASLLYTVAWCVISFCLAIGFRVIASLDSKIAGDDSGPRKIFVTKAQMKAAKAEMAREAKADAKAAPKGKKKKK